LWRATCARQISAAWLNIPLNTNAITLPVGVYLALIGGPFFLLILRRTRA